MKQLVRKAERELVRRHIEDFNALTSEVYASLVDHLDSIGALRVPPFDTAACDNATLQNLSAKRVDWFLETAGFLSGDFYPGQPLINSVLTAQHCRQGARAPTCAQALKPQALFCGQPL